jgi:putative membrane protein
MKPKSTTLLASVFAAALLASGCAMNHGTSHTGMGAGAAPHAAALSAADAAFVATAAGNDMYEIEVSRLALVRGSNAQVKNYAQMLVTHHTASSAQLMTIVRAKGATPPAGMPADKQAKIAELSRLQGAEFDRQYIRVSGVQDHQAAITIFEQASRTLTDADLRGFASNTLPVLRQHLQGAQAIAGTLAG